MFELKVACLNFDTKNAPQVERRTGIPEVMDSNSVEVLIFPGLLHNREGQFHQSTRTASQ